MFFNKYKRKKDDRFDDVISATFDKYTEEIVPPETAALPALSRVRAIRERKRAARKKFAFRMVAAVCALAILIGFSARALPQLFDKTGLIDKNNPQSEDAVPSKYSLSSLILKEIYSGDSGEHSASESAKNAKLLARFDSFVESLGNDSNKKIYFDVDTDSLSVISAEYIFLQSYGLDKLLIIADLKLGLTDYNSLKNITVKRNSEYKYENGEYYHYGYLRQDSIDYYFFLMSPTESGFSPYLELIG